MKSLDEKIKNDDTIFKIYMFIFILILVVASSAYFVNKDIRQRQSEEEFVEFIRQARVWWGDFQGYFIPIVDLSGRVMGSATTTDAGYITFGELLADSTTYTLNTLTLSQGAETSLCYQSLNEREALDLILKFWEEQGLAVKINGQTSVYSDVNLMTEINKFVRWIYNQKRGYIVIDP